MNLHELTDLSPLDTSLAPRIQARLDDLTKPPGSLGLLEDLVLQLGLIQQTTAPKADKRRIYCFASDHGVVAEGVSAYPAEVTPQMVLNMLSGGAAINALSQQAKAELLLVDVGVNFDFEAHPRLLDRKVAKGTRSLAQGPAMSEEECLRALSIGFELAKEAKAEGVELLGTGEMGIGNSTSATCLYAHFLGLEPARIAGPGTGLDGEGVRRKTEIIEKALQVNRERLQTPLGALAALGGFEIAAMAGLMLGAAKMGIPLIVDGFISAAAASAAMHLAPAVGEYLIFSHRSKEGAHGEILKAMGARPLLDLELRLGEGTGAALAMNLVEASLAFYEQMASFSSAGVSGKE